MTVSAKFWTELFAVPKLKLTDSPGLRALFVAWEQAENGVTDPHPPHHNPLNTTLRKPGSTAFNGVGVQNYVSREQGVEATAETLLDPRYSSIITALRTKADPYYTAIEVDRSPWGTSGWLMVQRLHDNGYGK